MKDERGAAEHNHHGKSDEMKAFESPVFGPKKSGLHKRRGNCHGGSHVYAVKLKSGEKQ